MFVQRPSAPELPSALNIDQVAMLLGCSKQHIRNLVARGQFPKPLKLGNSSRWRTVTVASYIAKLEKESNK